MKIGFIGAGKVGTAFGVYLKQHGFDVIGYYSRTIQSTRVATERTRTSMFKTPAQLVEHSDMIFVTTGDDQIGEVVEAIKRSEAVLEGKTFVHMSGALSSLIFNPLTKKGAWAYSAHPLQAFADIDTSVKTLKNTTFGIEGKDQLEALISVLTTTENRYITLKPDQKSRYHAIACIVSNYLVTLLDFGLELFDKIGIPPDIGMTAMLPMIQGTVDNVRNLGSSDALTGPIARGDVETIRQHLISFDSNEIESESFYKYLGLKTLELARKQKLTDKTKIKELEDLFR